MAAISAQSAAGPCRELFPDPGDILATEPERGEPPIPHPIQPPAGVREIRVPQPRVQPFGEADQLANGERPLQGGRDVPIVSRDGPIRFSELSE